MDVTPALRSEELEQELDQVEQEVTVISFDEDPAAGRKLCELAAREYEILEALTRRWRHP